MNSNELSDNPLGWRLEKTESKEPARYLVDQPFAFGASENRVLSELVHAYSELSAGDSPADANAREALYALLASLCKSKKWLIGKKTGEAMVDACAHTLAGFGPLDFLLNDASIEEISVSGAGEPVRVFLRAKGWRDTNVVLESDAYALSLVNKMARGLGRRISHQFPRLNAQLPDGSRLHAAAPPVSSHVSLTIRKFSENLLSPADLISFDTLSAPAASLLWLCLYADASVLVAGNTGSGKTTTLNALLGFIPLDERVVVVEETPELRPPQPHAVRLTANPELGIHLTDLVADTLRMRPDRVLVGEVRTPQEAAALFDSLLAGQARGTYATFHAQTALEAVNRLVSLGARREDLSALDLLVVQRRVRVNDKKSGSAGARELRKVTQTAEIGEGGVPQVLYQRDPSSLQLEPTRHLADAKIWKKLSLTFQKTPTGLQAESVKRAKYLAQLAEKAGESPTALPFADFCAKINEYSNAK